MNRTGRCCGCVLGSVFLSVSLGVSSASGFCEPFRVVSESGGVTRVEWCVPLGDVTQTGFDPQKGLFFEARDRAALECLFYQLEGRGVFHPSLEHQLAKAFPRAKFPDYWNMDGSVNAERIVGDWVFIGVVLVGEGKRFSLALKEIEPEGTVISLFWKTESGFPIMLSPRRTIQHDAPENPQELIRRYVIVGMDRAILRLRDGRADAPIEIESGLSGERVTLKPLECEEAGTGGKGLDRPR